MRNGHSFVFNEYRLFYFGIVQLIKNFDPWFGIREGDKLLASLKEFVKSS